MWTYHIFVIRSSADGHSGCFQILPTDMWNLKNRGSLGGGVSVRPTPRSARASRPRRPRPRATCPQPSVLCFLHTDGVVGRRPGALGVSVSACAFAAHARRPEPALAPRSRLHWNNTPSSGWTTFRSFTHPAMDTWVASTFLWYEE